MVSKCESTIIQRYEGSLQLLFLLFQIYTAYYTGVKYKHDAVDSNHEFIFAAEYILLT